MILTCPSCGTRYQTDRARIAPPGANVRCAKCQTVWFQAAESEVDIDPEPPQVEPPPLAPSTSDGSPESAVRRGEERRRGVRWSLVAGWLILLIFVGGFIWATIAYRHEIARVWPASATLYAYLDMPVNTRGLAFAELSHQTVVEAEGDVLQISGRVVNVADRALPVPEIYVSLRDMEERELYGWTFHSGASVLGPGQSQAFLTRLTDPPAQSRRADLRFVGDVAQ